MLLLQSLGIQSFAVRRSIKIPSYSERAVPFPRSSQTRKTGRNVSGRSGDPTSAAVTVQETNKASVPHSGSCVSAVVVAGSISPRLLLLLPLRAPAALRTLQCQRRCLSRDGDRPAPAGAAQSSATTTATQRLDQSAHLRV